MQFIVNAAQMKEADRKTIEVTGIPSLVLMERAAFETVSAMKEQNTDLSKALVVCGSGNNGGDGFAIARILWEQGYRCRTVFVGNEKSCTKETRTQMKILHNLGIPVETEWEETDFSAVIDAVFGIGISRPVEGRYRTVLEKMNACTGTKVAVDIASGISADTGRIYGVSFRADLTVTFAYLKVGQLLSPGREHSGNVLVRNIGIRDRELEEGSQVCFCLDDCDVSGWSPARPEDSNKGSFGKLLLIAGSRGMSGAAYLAARAAYASGAGLVRIFTEESNRIILQQQIPEAILTTYSQELQNGCQVLAPLLEWADAICLGCGLGQEKQSEELVRTVLARNRKPCLIDADGLNILAGLPPEEQQMLKNAPYVLTPHMKEMERLSGVSVERWKSERTELLDEFLNYWHAVCVLKDSRTVIAKEGEKRCINLSGSAAMSKAGAGDVLAGTIAGLLAQNKDVWKAAVLGTYLHGKAGEEAGRKIGPYSVLAGDIAGYIGKIWK